MSLSLEDWARVERLFHEALEQPESARLDYVRRQASTEAVRRAAARLVLADAQAPDFMNTSVAHAHAPPGLAPGALVERWRIQRSLGRGGMGEVYLARRDDADFEQTVALKLAHSADPAGVERFQRERAILAGLEHPNIGRLIDGGDGPDGRLFMVVEYIEGATITEFANARDLPLAARLELFLQLCEAVSYAHGRLVLHRDIKPANVMVTDSGQVRLVDFGVARMLDAMGQDSGPVTPHYAAPEQAGGGAVSARTDVYAMGRVLYELVARRRFDPDAPAAWIGDGDLRAIVARCLEPDPAARYGSADALAADIRRWLNREPVLARRGGPVYRLRKLVQRYPLPAAAMVAVFLSLSGGLYGTLTMAERARADAQRAERALAAEETARAELAYEARTLESFQYAMHALYGGDAEAGDEIEHARIDASLLRLADQAQAGMEAGSLDSAHLVYALGQHFHTRYDFERSAALFERVVRAEAVDPYLANQALSDLADALLELGQNDRALELSRQSQAQRRALGAQDHFGRVQDSYTVASVTGDPADADALLGALDEAIADFEADPSADRERLGWFHNQLGAQKLAQQEYAASAAAFARAFELSQDLGIRSIQDVVDATNLAQLQIYALGQARPALDYLPDYIGPTQGELVDDPLRNAFVHGLIADAALLERDWARAEREARLALPNLTGEREFRDGWYHAVTSMRAEALAGMGRAAEARDLLAAERAADPDPFGRYSACRLALADAFAQALTAGGAGPLDAAEAACARVEEPHDDMSILVKTVIGRQRANLRALSGASLAGRPDLGG